MPKENVLITQKCDCPGKEIGRGMRRIKLKALIILIFLKKNKPDDLATGINLFFPKPQANDRKIIFLKINL